VVIGQPRERGRGGLRLALAGCAIAGLLVGCSPTQTATNANPAPPTTARSATTPASAAPSATAPTPPRQAVTTPADLSHSPSVALIELDALAIKGRAPMTGYSRAQFGPAWPSIAGCDERNDTLRRDLTEITLDGGCEVTSGTLVSPYSATTIHFVRGPHSADVQIDHVVALGDAWQTGAQSWTPAQREAFANDPAELLAVDAHSNEQKGDADAASWLPSNKAFRCAYVSLQVTIKDRYRLWVTQAEHDAIAGILGRCAGTAGPTTRATATPATPAAATSVPTSVPTPVPPPQPASTAPATSATPITPITPIAKDYVTPGAFCSTAGATGVSKTGKAEVCTTTATDTRLRWRGA